MSGTKLRAIVKRTDERYGHVTNVSDSLENLQKHVDGSIQAVTFNRFGGFVVICNENWIAEGKDVNCYIDGVMFGGDIVVFGDGGEVFCDCPLQLEDWKALVDQGAADLRETVIPCDKEVFLPCC